MWEVDYQENQDVLFRGAYIRWLREYYNIKQLDLASAIHISNSVLSKNESGVRPMSEETFTQAIAYVKDKVDPDYHFNDDPKALDYLRKSLSDEVTAMIRLNKDRYESILNDVYDRRRELEHSRGFFIFQIMVLMREYLGVRATEIRASEDAVSRERFIAIKNNLNLYTPFERAYAMDTLSLILRDSGRFDESQQLLELSEREAVASHNSGMLGMIYYHKILNYIYAGQPSIALPLFDTCYQALRYMLPYRRLMYLELNRANCYSMLGATEEAFHIYQNMLEQAKDFNDERLLNAIYEEYAWNCFSTRHFEEAIQYATEFKYRQEPEQSSYYTFYPNIIVPFSWYKLKQPQKALESIRTYFSEARTWPKELIIPEEQLILKVLRGVILRNNSAIKRYGKSLLALIPRFPSFLAAYILELEADYWRSQNNTDKLLACQDRLIQVLSSPEKQLL